MASKIVNIQEGQTENILYRLLENQGYKKNETMSIDFKSNSCSGSQKVTNCLAMSSKNNTGNPGRPDVIVYDKLYSDMVMLIEAKAESDKHSKAMEELSNYAVGFKGEFNVVCVAVSGMTEDTFSVTSWVVCKDGSVKYGNEVGYDDSVLLQYGEYHIWVNRDKTNEETELKKVKDSAAKINSIINNLGSLTPDRRMLLVSACFLGYKSHEFMSFYRIDEGVEKGYKDGELIVTNPEKPYHKILDKLLQGVESALRQNNIKSYKIETMMFDFKGLNNVPYLTDIVTMELKKGKVKRTVNANPIMAIMDVISETHTSWERISLGASNVDIMGEFYNEFISNGQDIGNAKSGFVLTPRHICELFTDLANISPEDKVLDLCFGTGGFLVAAMQKEIEKANRNRETIKKIKAENLHGVELDGDRFTYGCVNMILRGDGQSNMIQGDSLDRKVIEKMKAIGCRVGFINPPYTPDSEVLHFIQNMLECLTVGGMGIAIVPTNFTSYTTNNVIQKAREDLLKEHTLEAVMTMPRELFGGKASTHTCIMIFTAHKPHPEGYKTWFADCKDDGFVSTRKGRSDINGEWENRKSTWVNDFLNKEETNYSTKCAITATDDWLYESVSATDFSKLCDDDFDRVLQDYSVFLLVRNEDEKRGVTNA